MFNCSALIYIQPFLVRPLFEIQCFRRHLGWPVFAYLNCDGLEWIDRVVFGAASSAARALERSVPVRQPSLVKFVPVSGPSETSPVAGRPQLGQKLLAPDISLLLADGFINPNYEDYCLAQICVSQAGRLPKCPFSLANYRVRWGTARQ